MKLLKTSFLALAMIAGSCVAFAQTAEEIVKKHIEAIGGADNWRKVKGFKMVGNVTGNGTEFPVSYVIADKKAMRMEFDLMGMKNYMIVTPTEGWVFFPIQGQTQPEALTADQIKEMQDQLDLQGELVDYQQKGSKIELLGKDEMEGTETYKLKLIKKDGKEKTLFFDVANYHLLREVQKINADGKEVEATNSFSNFKKLPEGITIPMTVESDMGPVTLTEVEINPTIDESIFKPSN